MPGPKPTPAHTRVMRRSAISARSSHQNIPCVECSMATNGDGYPVVSDGSKSDGTLRQITAAQAVWEHHFGPVPDGMVVLRKCRNRACVNVTHLALGTFKDDASRRPPSRGAAKLSESDVRQIRRTAGARHVDLAKDYGVTARTIANIRSGRTWR